MLTGRLSAWRWNRACIPSSTAALRVILWLVTLCIVLDYMGVPMTSLVALLGVIGLAVSLAIQGTLSNLAGGIQILLSKPFKAGDYVEAGGVSGTVKEVGLAYTKLATVDNKVISVPNGQISGEKIINYTMAELRRVDLVFGVSYDAQPEQVIACIKGVVGAHPMALFTPGALYAPVRLPGQQHRVYCPGVVRHWGLLGFVLRSAGAGQGGL